MVKGRSYIYTHFMLAETSTRSMALVKTFFSSLCLFSLFVFPYFHQATSTISPQRQTYIVHVQQPGSAPSDLDTFYGSFLSAVNPELRLIHSYKNVARGFAVQLTEHELEAMSALPGFIAAYADRMYQLQTTRTPAFLGLPMQHGLWNQSGYGKGIIIGVIDSGILPDQPSFSGIGMPPPPAKWKGRCDFNASSCNNKLIGAQSLLKGFDAPIDWVGHGTHTAATAAGAAVPGAQALGQAYGVATGMAPHAHLAIYLVCTLFGCPSSAVLAAMDSAVADGVDILSLSLGGGSEPFNSDVIAQGAFGAIEKGIFVSCAASNDGPGPGTLSNEAPWILTVAAGTMDRNIRVTVKLGNGLSFDGESFLQPPSFAPNLYPLVYAGIGKNPNAVYCDYNSLDDLDVEGKIVLCELGGRVSGIDKGYVVKNAGGAGMILTNQPHMGYSTPSNDYVLPASHVGFFAGEQIKGYINSSSNPTAALIFKGTIVGTAPAPTVAYFSSRGPSIASPGILKPDITGPGVNVLAASSMAVGSPPNLTFVPTFEILSGTSMSTPHLSGIAALLKSAHPDWSPAAIKSAIMTTASVVDRRGNPILDERLLPADLFAMGAGYVNPVKAGKPGLIYDLTADDYIAYLCGLGYTDDDVSVVARRQVVCANVHSIQEKDLNYPSITVTLGGSETYTEVVRTVKNVGTAKATYWAKVGAPLGVDVRVYPRVLRFRSLNQELKFKVTFKLLGGGGGGGGGGDASAAQGYLKWVSSKNVVRSPISINFKN